MIGKSPIHHRYWIEIFFNTLKHYTSLELLTTIFNVTNPKDDIDGSQVATVYYQDNDIDRIIKYCEKDTVSVAQIMLRLRREPILEPHEIIIV